MVKRNSEDNDRRTEQFRKLFIGGLTPQTDGEMLKTYYEQWGEIVDVVVMKDPRTARSRGFGFITYKEPEMVDAAQAKRPHKIDGKEVEAKRAMPREDSHSPESHMTVNKLFVGALKKDVTKEDLKEYFKGYGNIVDAEVVCFKENGQSRGFGFVTFDDYDPVDKAILYRPHNIGTTRSDVRKALSKDQINSMKKKQDHRGDYGNSYNGGYGSMGGYGYDGYGGNYGGQYSGGYAPNSNGNGYGAGGYDGGWGGNANGGQSWNHSMNDSFGSYGNQSFTGGPMRGGQASSGYPRNSPYGGILEASTVRSSQNVAKET